MPKARSCSMATSTEQWLCVSRQQRAMNLVSQSRSWLDQFNSQSWAWDVWRMTWEPTWTSRIATLNVDDTRFRWTESWGPTIFLLGWIDLKLLTKCKRSNKWKGWRLKEMWWSSSSSQNRLDLEPLNHQNHEWSLAEVLDEVKDLWPQNENVLEVGHAVVDRGLKRFRQRVGQWLRGQELRRVKSPRRSLSFRAGHRRPLQLRGWMCSTSVVRAEGWRQSSRRKIGPKPDPSTWVRMVCQSPSSCTMAKGCKDQPKIPRKLTEQCVSVERFWSQTKAHFGPTCLPSTAYPRSCGKFGKWSTRFGRKNLRNQLKLQNELKPRNRRRAGLLRLPPGQLSQQKPADQSLKSQGLNLWCSRLLKDQKAVGEKRPMMM